MFKEFITSLGLMGLTAAASAQTLEQFAAMPGVEGARYSADGQYLALGCQGQLGQAVCVYNLAEGGTLRVFSLPEFMTQFGFYFASPDHIMLEGRFTDTIQTGNGPRLFDFNRALVFDLQTGEARTFMDNVGAIRDSRLVVSLDESDPNSVLAEATFMLEGGNVTGSGINTDDQLASVLLRVDLNTGSADRVETDRISGRIVRPDGTISAHIRYEPETGEYEVRRMEGGRRSLYEGEHRSDAPVFQGFADETGYVFLFPAGENRGLRRLDIETGELTALTPETDGAIFTTIVDPHRNVVVGYNSTRDDMPAQELIDEQLAGTASALARALQVDRVLLHTWTEDRSSLVFSPVQAGRPTDYYIFDRAASNVSPAGSAYPDLAQVPTGSVTAFAFEASDGLQIPAMLTLPPGQTVEDGPFPLVVMPHGGPRARDTREFDWWAQAYAANGYAVVQPNFRGSAGYGQSFIEAGYGEFGGLMIQDMLDSAEYLRAAGVAQPGPACFVGASYGGYAALMAGLRAPDEVACSVAVNAVTDPIVLLGDAARVRDRGGLEFWEQYIGSRFMGSDDTTAISPQRRASEISVPTLLLHGETDLVVPISQAEALANRMSGNDSFTFEVLEGTDHYLANSPARLEILQRSLSLLDETLK